MHDILLQIIEKKKQDLLQQANPKNKFKTAISNAKDIAIITELKFASPTVVKLGTPSELLSRAKQYEEAGANAISIITEKHFFKGDPLFIKQVKESVSLPILQKDFVIDASQIYEAKALGSDALLLIARLVDKKTLQKFVEICLEIGIEPVVEINDEEDLAKALKTKTNIIAVNARDLQTFAVSVSSACELLRKIPSRFIRLGFSGIHTAAEVAQYKAAGADAVLVGTSIMRAENISEFIKNLRVLPEVQVKICGIQTIEDANHAIAAGADYIGFIFVDDSARPADPLVVKEIVAAVGGKIKTVGVFKHHSVQEINTLCEELSLDLVQLHDVSDPGFCEEIRVPVIASFGLVANFDVEETRNAMKKHSDFSYVIDREKPGKGQALSLEKAAKLAESLPIFFAGGLTPENVVAIVQKVRPFGVDVAGGVKTDGKVDPKKVKKFVKRAKGVM